MLQVSSPSLFVYMSPFAIHMFLNFEGENLSILIADNILKMSFKKHFSLFQGHKIVTDLLFYKFDLFPRFGL